MRGTIKFWNETRGFGFITRAGEADTFAHANNLAEPDRMPKMGDEVEFEIGRDVRTKKSLATNIVILGW